MTYWRVRTAAQAFARRPTGRSVFMPTKIVVPKELFAAVQGRTMDLCELFACNPESLKSVSVSMIGTTSGDTGVICRDKQRIRDALEERDPLLLRPLNIVLFGRQVWRISKAEQACDKDQLRLLFLDTLDKEREKWERLKRKFSGVAGKPVEHNREPIPQSVRIFVWRRDKGKCVQCGKSEKLEFDHIIPVSKGGGNTERNIQLLCESCNRMKSANI